MINKKIINIKEYELELNTLERAKVELDNKRKILNFMIISNLTHMKEYKKILIDCLNAEKTYKIESVNFENNCIKKVWTKNYVFWSTNFEGKELIINYE